MLIVFASLVVCRCALRKNDIVASQSESYDLAGEIAISARDSSFVLNLSDTIFLQTAPHTTD